MASLILDRRNGKHTFRLTIGSGKNRKRIWLGKLDQAVAKNNSRFSIRTRNAVGIAILRKSVHFGLANEH